MRDYDYTCSVFFDLPSSLFVTLSHLFHLCFASSLPSIYLRQGLYHDDPFSEIQCQADYGYPAASLFSLATPEKKTTMHVNILETRPHRYKICEHYIHLSHVLPSSSM